MAQLSTSKIGFARRTKSRYGANQAALQPLTQESCRKSAQYIVEGWVKAKMIVEVKAVSTEVVQ